MEEEPGLFVVPDQAYLAPPSDEPLSRSERRHRLIATRIASSVHPLGKGIPLHADAARDRDGDGLRCGSCRWREALSRRGKTYPKCTIYNGIRATGCESSDVRAWWPACSDHESGD